MELALPVCLFLHLSAVELWSIICHGFLMVLSVLILSYVTLENVERDVNFFSSECPMGISNSPKVFLFCILENKPIFFSNEHFAI